MAQRRKDAERFFIPILASLRLSDLALIIFGATFAELRFFLCALGHSGIVFLLEQQNKIGCVLSLFPAKFFIIAAPVRLPVAHIEQREP